MPLDSATSDALRQLHGLPVPLPPPSSSQLMPWLCNSLIDGESRACSLLFSGYSKKMPRAGTDSAASVDLGGCLSSPDRCLLC